MIQKLFNISYKRNFQDALIFYVFYLLVFSLVTILVEYIIFAIFSLNGNAKIEIWIELFLTVLSSMIFSFVILLKKNLVYDYRYIITVILVGVISFIFRGYILSMIIITYLTTLDLKDK